MKGGQRTEGRKKDRPILNFYTVTFEDRFWREKKKKRRFRARFQFSSTISKNPGIYIK